MLIDRRIDRSSMVDCKLRFRILIRFLPNIFLLLSAIKICFEVYEVVRYTN